MADIVQNAAPAAAALANSADNMDNSVDNQEIEGLETEGSDESDGQETKDVPKGTEKKAKVEEKKVKAEEKRIKKLKLKVDGKEIEESLDLDNDEELIRQLQMAKMGQKRAQEKSDLEKQINSFLQALKTDPFEALKRLGEDPNQLIENYITAQEEHAKKSPEQLEREKLERELTKLKTEREREREDQKQKELHRLQEQAFQQYDVQMEQALSKADVPKTPYVIKKIADYMIVAIDAGYDVTPDDVIPLVREELNSDLKEMFSSLDEASIEALLGEQVLNRLRKRRVAKAQAANTAVSKPQVTDTGKSSKAQEIKPGDKKSFKDFFGV